MSAGGYAGIDDLRAELGSTLYRELYQGCFDGSDGDSATRAAADLGSAAAEIDGALATRYRLPVSGDRALALLRDWNTVLTLERAYARAASPELPEKVKTRVAQVREYLRMVRADEFLLPGAPEKSGAEGGVALVQCDDPVFGRKRMEGF